MFRELARLGVSRAAAFFYAVAVGVVANVVIAHLSPHDGATPTPPTSWPAAAKPETPIATAIITPRAEPKTAEAKPAEAKTAEPARAIDASAPANSLPSLLPTQAVASPITPALPAMNTAALPSAPTHDLTLPHSLTPPTKDPAVPESAAMAAPSPRPAALPSAPQQAAPPPVIAPAAANAVSTNPPPVAAPITASQINAPQINAPQINAPQINASGAPVAAEGTPAPDQPATNVEASAGSPQAAPISLLPSDPTQPASDQPKPKPSQPGPGSGGLY